MSIFGRNKAYLRLRAITSGDLQDLQSHKVILHMRRRAEMKVYHELQAQSDAQSHLRWYPRLPLILTVGLTSGPTLVPEWTPAQSI